MKSRIASFALRVILSDGFNFDALVANVIERGGHILRTVPLRKALLVSNSASPLLYGLPKVHKPGMSVRPVVSYALAPIYLLAKYSDRWFKSVVVFVPPIL